MAAFAMLDAALAGVPGIGPGEGGVGPAATGDIAIGPDDAAQRRLFYRAWLTRRLP